MPVTRNCVENIVPDFLGISLMLVFIGAPLICLHNYTIDYHLYRVNYVDKYHVEG